MWIHVIVDVPTGQTDHPFTYRVPAQWQASVKVGVRVHVPFGIGNRLIQGVVVALDVEPTEGFEMKEIAAVLDEEPVLTAEQLWLVEQLRHQVFSFKIQLLKTMMPSLLQSQYDKFYQATEKLGPDDRQRFFPNGSERQASKMSPEDLAEVQKLVAKKQVEVQYLALNQASLKYENWYRPVPAVLESLVIGKQAKRRLEARDYLLQKSDEGRLVDFNKEFSSAISKYFREVGAIEVYSKSISRSASFFEGVESTQPPVLNPQQAAAKRLILGHVGEKKTQPVLLEGITGSGKTEVYLQVIEQVLKDGKNAIVLVPEISLTPQMTRGFIARFGYQVAILHSGLSAGEKYDEWWKIAHGQARVVIGARSAIFAPLQNIGIIIIDEEHESSYKQDNNPRYHAREVAQLRAQYHQAALVLGSATPSLESRARASKGVYDFVTLSQRANPLAMIPSVEVIDLRDYRTTKEDQTISPPLLEALKETLERGEQAVLMLNRRGYSSFMMCRVCGEVDTCPNCDISLTLHLSTRTMNCHYCDFRKGIPQTCPNCQSQDIHYYGTGTEKAQKELELLLPEARVLRMDVDTTRKKGSHEKILAKFGQGEADILLGTQMIAKGLDFPNVTLVGVLNADTGIHLPDFRSSERTFQLLTQVAGRAGRATKPGKVYLQTYNPDHYAIQYASKQDYEGFYQEEMRIRKMAAYPPYFYTVALHFSHKDPKLVEKIAYQALGTLRQFLSPNAILLGPTPSTISRTHNLYHYQIMIKYRQEPRLEAVLNHILEISQTKEFQAVRLTIDHEPQ
ncbi:primosomal protein N' [Streptococcus danieliae]|uniref:Replication restart protein PriA n=1 Tax=Streptococcus danieliae TaxID=747656 RepID=A0A7X3G9J7_9STRE|nr:primosomal protein N' [Streptococcus danieliae]MVX58911.1 primosomal protein N' [Streptococcus danieliae]